MKLAISQFKSVKGEVSLNIVRHKQFVELAASADAEAIFFPELSLTGYEPSLAKKLAIYLNDPMLDEFQHLSNDLNMLIAAGMPTIAESGVLISLIVFQPYKQRTIYSKQQLHSDELPWFIEGKEQLILTCKDKKIAPAICYESLQAMHAENAFKLGANIYLACVAKSQIGLNKAMLHYPEVASKYSKTVLMSNCVGFCDDFESVGSSAIWTSDGTLAGQLDNHSEGVLIFDTETEEVREILI